MQTDPNQRKASLLKTASLGKYKTIKTANQVSNVLSIQTKRNIVVLNDKSKINGLIYQTDLSVYFV